MECLADGRFSYALRGSGRASTQARFAGPERFHAGAGLASAEEPMRVPIARESSGQP